MEHTKTRLIIAEGLPGAGKSTTAAIIADELRKAGEKVLCVDEGVRDHPADCADYDFPNFETERKKILEKWRSFVDRSDKDTIYVFNCIFLQNPMCETMMRFGMESAASQQYISEIAEIVRPLHPLIVYIDRPDVKGTVDRVLDERGDDWLEAVMDYHTSQGYGKLHHLSGYEGYLKCLEERKVRELHILQALGIDYLIISHDLKPGEFAKLWPVKKKAAPFSQEDGSSKGETSMELVQYPQENCDKRIAEKIAALEDTAWPREGGKTVFPSAPGSYLTSFVLMETGMAVCHVGIRKAVLSHRGEEYLAYGLSEVVTHPDYQKRGLATQMIKQAAQFIRAQQPDISIFTCAKDKTDFYARGGWKPVPGACFVGGTKEKPFRSDSLHLVTMMMFLSPKSELHRKEFEHTDIIFELGENQLW